MTDVRDKSGKFVPGNPGGRLKTSVYSHKLKGEDDISFMIRKGKQLVKLIDYYGEQSIETLKSLMSEATSGKISGKEAAIIKYWSRLITEGDVARMKLLLNIYRIPTELKAVAVQDVTQPQKNNEQVNKVDLNKDEKLKMLEKMKLIVESSEE